MAKKFFSTKTVAGLGIFSALAFILYLPIFEIPLFPGTPYKLDLSNVFVLLGGFMYGPFGGVVILLIKEAIHIPIGGTGGVGELANLLVGLAFILVPNIVYHYKKGLKIVIITLLIGCVLQTIVGIIANKFILLPFFNCSEMFDEWFIYIVLLNLIKSVADSVLTVITYKKLSYLFKKIRLQD